MSVVKRYQRDELLKAAGFFNGEGSAGCYGKSCQLRISCVQTEWEPLEQLRRAVGGFGKIYGPNNMNKYPSVKRLQAVSTKSKPWRLQYVWCVSNDDAIKVAKILGPHLNAYKGHDVEVAVAKRKAWQEKKLITEIYKHKLAKRGDVLISHGS
jgi:hypothetical protein